MKKIVIPEEDLKSRFNEFNFEFEQVLLRKSYSNILCKEETLNQDLHSSRRFEFIIK